MNYWICNKSWCQIYPNRCAALPYRNWVVICAWTGVVWKKKTKVNVREKKNHWKAYNTQEEEEEKEGEAGGGGGGGGKEEGWGGKNNQTKPNILRERVEIHLFKERTGCYE